MNSHAHGHSHGLVDHSIRRSHEGLRAVGLALGVLASVAAGGSLGSLLYDVRPSDPRVLGGVAALLAAVAALACWVPARRASRALPGDALRLG